MKMLVFAAGITVVSACGAVSADVVDGAGSYGPLYSEDTSFGADTSVIDPRQNLEFLDLNLSAGISYDDMLSDGLVEGGVFEGWRHATRSEMIGLVVTLGYLDEEDQDERNDVFIQDGSLLPLMELFEFVFLEFPSSDNLLTVGFIAESQNETLQYTAVLLEDTVEMNAFIDTAFAVPGDNGAPGLAHYLVREVPSPGSLSLLGLALVGAARRRR